MSSQKRSFDSFLSLPTEIRSKQLGVSPSPKTSNIIRVHFTQQAYHEEPYISPKTSNPKINYKFQCFSPPGPHGPPIPYTKTRNSYANFLRRKPGELRFDQGQCIRFNPSTDIIFMDCASLYALGQYLLYTDSNVIQQTLKGFSDIQMLGTPLRHCNRKGFVSEKKGGLRRYALSGVKSFVMLKDVPGVLGESKGRRELINDLDGQLRDLLVLGGLEKEAIYEILKRRVNILRDVYAFFGESDLEAGSSELKGIETEEEGEEQLEKVSVLVGFDASVDEREQCMELDCSFCTMQTWEEKRYSIARQR